MPGPGIPRSAEERITRTDEAGNKLESEFWFRGQRVGRADWDPEEDGPARATTLRNGRRHGFDIEYTWGRVSYVEPFVHGRQHGWARQYDQRGRLIIECPFKNGTGVDYWCGLDDRLSEEHPLVDGRPSGNERWWFDELSIYEETGWLDGDYHGVRRRWHDGKLESGYPEFYIRGKKVSKRAYLAACKTDSTLPKYMPGDDAAERQLPEQFIRLRERARKKQLRLAGRRRRSGA